MIRILKRGFTLVEIITVVFIVALLSTALYMGTQPYMRRSRDTKRITDIGSYMNIVDAYNSNFEIFPSNEGSGGSMIPGYCLSELYTRPSYVGFADKQFQTIGSASVPPSDPLHLAPIGPCDMTGSYLYSRMDYATNKQIAIIAARLEQKTTSNYGTGADLTNTGHIGDILTAKRGTVPEDAIDAIYLVYKTR